jgi:hypothetical protein
MKKVITSFLGIVGVFGISLIFASTTHAEEIVNQKPVIIFYGPASVKVVVGEPIPNLGARVIDAEDGNITRKLVVTGEATDPSSGLYTLTYTATDSGGLSADPMKRTVSFFGTGGGSDIAYVPSTPKPVQSEEVSPEPKPIVLIDRSDVETVVVPKAEPDFGSVSVSDIE